MKRWLPFPLFALTLLVMWLVLNGTLEPAHVILGTVLAVASALTLSALQVPGRPPRRLWLLAEVSAIVIADIVRSNFAVARIVLNPRVRGRKAGFIRLPLEARHPAVLAILATIITATPGTSWAGYDRGQNIVTIHVLDLVDEEAWVRLFKDRYERRLLEVYG